MIRLGEKINALFEFEGSLAPRSGNPTFDIELTNRDWLPVNFNDEIEAWAGQWLAHSGRCEDELL